MREYLSIPEVAEELDVSTKTVRRFIKGGELPAVFLAGKYRIDPADVKALVDAHRVRGPGRPPKRAAVAVA